MTRASIASMLLLVVAPVAAAQASPPAAAPQPAPQYVDFAVRRQAAFAPDSPQPAYPAALRAAGVHGMLVAQVVVDQDGRAMVPTLKVVRSDDPAFVESLKVALPQLRFMGAKVGDRSVRQLVELRYAFGPSGTAAVDTVPVNPELRVLRVDILP